MKNKSGSFVCSAIPFFPLHRMTLNTQLHKCVGSICAHWQQNGLSTGFHGHTEESPEYCQTGGKKQKHYKKQKGWKQGHLTLRIDSWWPKENLGQALRLTGAALGGHFGWSQELLCGFLWVESQGYLGCSTIATLYVKTLQAWYPRWSILQTSLDRGTTWHQANFTLQQWKSLQWQSERPHILKGAPPDSSRSHCKWRFWFCLNERNEWG